MSQSIKNSIVFALFFTLLGCSQPASNSTTEGSQGSPSVGEPPAAEAPPSGTEIDPDVDSSVPEICSALSFDDVSWPGDYSLLDEVAFALAMNITGSFEGHAGWTNLSNNFDGQGVSMGILNQNLGQGTLQPLLIHMRDNHLSVLQKAMTTSMLNSLLGMLSDWERSVGVTLSSLQPENSTEQRELILVDTPDIDKKYAFVGLQTLSNSASVNWAKQTLYTNSAGTNFKTSWRNALKEIAGDPAYISQQIEAAQYIHDRAMGYRDRLGWQQLRSYLFLFDIVVQNGSLRDKHFDQFDDWLNSQNSRVTEEEQMLEMLEIRVKDVIKKWQNDVRSRKRTVILGSGFVHGENRNLPVEYCYDPIMGY